MHRSFTKKLFSVHFCLEKFFVDLHDKNIPQRCVFTCYIFHSETILFLKVIYLSGFEERKRSITLYQNYASYLELVTGLEPATCALRMRCSTN